LDNLTLSSSDHISQFYAAAHWFNKHQDKKSGGWINPVTRKISPVIKPLKPGWYVTKNIFNNYKIHLYRV